MPKEPEKYQILMNYLRENPGATYNEIKKNTELSNNFIRSHRTEILNELRRSESMSDSDLEKIEQRFNNKFDKLQERVHNSLATGLAQIKADVIKNNDQKEVKDMDPEEIKQIVEGVTLATKETDKELVKGIVGGLEKIFSPLMKERQEKERKTQKQEADIRIKQIAQEAAKEIVEPVQEKVDKHEQLLCDDKGNCVRVSTEEFEKFKATKPQSQDIALTKKQFLQTLESTSPEIRKEALDTILTSKEIKPLEIIDMAMQRCKDPEACETAANLLCEKYKDLCVLIQKKFKEKKEFFLNKKS